MKGRNGTKEKWLSDYDRILVGLTTFGPNLEKHITSPMGLPVSLNEICPV